MKMKKILFVALSLLLLLAFGCSHDTNNSSVTNPNPNTVYPKGYLQGYVLDACTRAPIVGAVVDIGIAKATTNSNGQYIMRDVPATSYIKNTDVNGNLDINDGDTEVKIDASIDSGYSGKYSATVDLTNARINGVKVTVGPGGYAAKYYNEVSVKFASMESSSGIISADNADITPVLGLGNGDYDFLLGALTSGITGYAVDAKTIQPVPAGYTVYLFSTFKGDDGNSATGGYGNQVGKTTTDATGKFVFSNIEANQEFNIKVVDTATGTPKFMGFKKAVQTDCNGRILYFGIQDGNAVMVSSTDEVCPFPINITANGHANHADISKDEIANGVDVIITFSEPIAPTELNTGRALLATSDTDSMDNLYKDIAVKYLGNKAVADIHHTLSWVGYVDASNPGPMTQLKISIPPEALQPAAMYGILITDNDFLKDASGNKLRAEIGDWDTSGVDAEYRCGRYFNVWETLFQFTTYGARTAAQVTGLHAYVTGHPEQESFDYDDHATIDWTAVDGAKRYNVYCRMIQWNTTTTVPCGTDTFTGQFHPYYKVGETELTGFDLNFQGSGGFYTEHESYEFEYVESLNIKLSYECYVLGVDADGIEGATPSNTVLIEDNDPPHITSVTDLNGSPIVAGSTITGIKVCFSEPMQEYFLEPRPAGDTTSVGHAVWTVNSAAFVTGTGFGSVVSTINYIPRDMCLYVAFDDEQTVTLLSAATAACGASPVTLTVLSYTGTFKDIAGNLLEDPEEGSLSPTPMLPLTITYTPLVCPTP